MTYDVGDLVTLSTVVKNDAGVPVNTPTVVIAVTKPDGTLVTPAPNVTNSGANGIYTAPLTVDAAGVWTYLWTASGTVVGKEYGQLEVAAPRALVASMEEAKGHLRLTDTDAEDARLKDVLVAVTDLMEPAVGPVTPTTYTETHCGVGDTIVPRRTPLVSVTSITPYLGSALAADAYRADTDLGAIFLRYVYAYEYTLVYRAGHNPWPGALKQAGLIISQHEWAVRNGGRPSADADPLDVVPGFGFLVPRRALELMRPHLHAGVA